MFRSLQSRPAHYALLLIVTAALTLPGLGSMSLWDIDEGLNAEAAREMLESGNWVVPTFNFKPRTAKPALLYWLQAIAYEQLGVNEFAARLPSALAGAIAVLLTYELARRMYSPTTGLLSGIILISTVQVDVLVHAATPDAVLLACLTLTFFLFWIGVGNGGQKWAWMIGPGCGLAMLAKGPIGLALPVAVIGYYFLARRELGRVFDRRVWIGIGLLVLVAGPWYVRVGAETHGSFIRSFWQNENVGRFTAAMEGHSGPVYFYLLSVLIGLAPWCVFVGPTIWYALKAASSNATCFLLCWCAVYLGFFSLAQTKLPNYVLPVFPPLAILTARFLDRWRLREIQPAPWVVPTSLAALVAVGLVTIFGQLIAAGRIYPSALGDRAVAGVAFWAWLGVVPILAAVVATWCILKGQRSALIGSVATAAVAFVGALAAFPAHAVDSQKAPRALAELSGARCPNEDVRIACLAYFQPSLVFYCRREVNELNTMEQALAFLRNPMPAYLFCSADMGESIRLHAPDTFHELARRRTYFAAASLSSLAIAWAQLKSKIG